MKAELEALLQTSLTKTEAGYESRSGILYQVQYDYTNQKWTLTMKVNDTATTDVVVNDLMTALN